MSAQPPHTLIVDDEANIRIVLQAALKNSGHRVTLAASGEEALKILRDTAFDVVILDLNLGSQIDGQRVLEAIRWRWPAAVVIILTGHGTLQSAMSAIQEGVDGYLLKPVDVNELRKTIDEAHQRALTRTIIAEPAAAPDPGLRHGGLLLDPARHRLEVHGRPVDLTAHEFNLLRYMLADPGRVFSARELVRAVQNVELERDQEAREVIKWYIHRLRQKIEADPQHPRHLINVRGVGYRLGD